MPIHDIVLFPFGGAARMEISRKPIEEMIMALAGPAVNVVLIPVFMIIGPWNEILTLLGYYNIVLLVFNLVPAFPMDGGRVVRSALSHFMGDHERATLIAGRIGQVCAVGFVALAIYSGAWMLALIGVFVFLAAQREIMQSSQVNPQLASERDVKQSNDNVAEIQRRMADLDRRYRES
jgi:Zn-dependent protease